MRAMACAWLITSLAIVNLSRLPSTWVCIVYLVGIALFALCIRHSRAAITGVILGVLTLGWAFWHLSLHQLQAKQISVDMTVVVQVNSVPERYEGRQSFIARVLSCESCEHVLRVKTIRLSWYGDSPKIRAGESWRLVVRLKPPVSLRNKGGFDAVAWAVVKGLHATGYVRNSDLATRVVYEDAAVTHNVLRQGAIDRLDELAGDKPHLGLLQALTVGFKMHITDTQWDLLRNTGTAHLLAISGLHVGLVAAWALVMCRWIAVCLVRVVQAGNGKVLHLDTRTWALTGSLLAALAYASLAGFELPTQRAVLMLGVWMIAALRFRFLPPMAALCLALIVVLFMNALNLLSAGFWLSFGTVATLLYLHRGHVVKQGDTQGLRWQTFIAKGRSMLRTHVFLGVVLLPVTAWFFQSGSLVAPLANLVAVPWVAMVSVPLSLLGLAASYFSQTLAVPLLALAEGSLGMLMIFLSRLDQSVLSALVLTIPGVLAFAFILVGLLIAFAPRGLGLHFFVLPLMLPAIMHNAVVPVHDGFEVHVLDVGQGLAVLVYAGDQTLLFDTGGKVSPNLSMFEAVVVPFLQATGRRRVDTLVVSHGDEDHSFGTEDVVRRFSDVQIFASQQPALPDGYQVASCEAGKQWSMGQVHFGFLHPAALDAGSDNDRSCVLMIYMGSSRVLLTGDIEASAEQSLLSRLSPDERFPVTLLTAPHHGSRTSSSQAFVDTFRPEYVVYPAGLRNRYGFPHSDVQLRYKLAGAKSFVTGFRGAVSFVFGPEGLSQPPISWWNSHRRFWHGIVNPDCWRQFAGQSFALRLLKLSQKGQTLCGK